MLGDDFYKQLREKVAGYSGPYAEYVLLAPDLFMLLARLMLDRRVETRHKAFLGAALAYALSPLDLLSESRLGVAGYLDDVAVVVAALHHVLGEIDPAIVLEHWSGSGDLLAKVREILAKADDLVGKSRFDKIMDALGMRRPPAGAGA